jgi:hypothetical protein
VREGAEGEVGRGLRGEFEILREESELDRTGLKKWWMVGGELDELFCLYR